METFDSPIEERTGLNVTSERGERLRNELRAKNLNDVIARIFESDRENISRDEKRRILTKFDPEFFLHFLPEFGFANLDNFLVLRGFVFEYLVRQEIEGDKQEKYLGDFITNCLKNPQIFGVDFARKNPDYIRVTYDERDQIIFINEVYEIKLGGLSTVGLGKRGETQLNSFGKNLGVAVGMINRRITELQKKFKLTKLPDNGIMPPDLPRLKKILIFPQATKPFEHDRFNQREAQYARRGWILQQATFSVEDVDLLTAGLMNEFEDDGRMGQAKAFAHEFEKNEKAWKERMFGDRDKK